MMEEELLASLDRCSRWIQWLTELHREDLGAHAFHTKMQQGDGNISMTSDLSMHLAPEYLSPEETGRLAGVPDHRSDIYRLGTVLYEVMTGKPPFFASDPIRTIWMHISQKPAELHTINKDIPRIISAIIMKMLSKDPRVRYQSMHGLSADWNKARSHVEIGRPDIFALGETDLPLKFSFTNDAFANTAIFEKIRFLPYASGQGPTRRCVIIHGAEGQGKSYILGKLHTEKLRDNEVSVLGSFMDDDKLPYNTLRSIFNQVYRSISNQPVDITERIRQTVEASAGENLGLLPSFATDWGKWYRDLQEGPQLDVQESQNRLAYTLAKVLGAVTETRTVWIWLDDGAFASSESLHLLKLILDESTLRNIRLTIANNPDSNNNIRNFAAEAGDANDLELLQLQCLPAGESELASVLGHLYIAQEQQKPLAALIARKTGGNPSAVKQLLENAALNGYLTPSVETMDWRADLEKLEAMEVADTMVNSLIGTFSQLGPIPKLVIQCASILGKEFDPALLDTAFPDLNAEVISNAIADLLKGGLIQKSLHESTYVFSNNKVYEEVRKTVQQVQSTTFASRVAQFIYASGSYREADRSFYDLVNLVLALDKPSQEKYKDIILEAAQKAESVGAFEAAFRSYQALLPAEGVDTAKLDIHCKAMEMQLYALNFDYHEKYDSLLRQQPLGPVQVAALDLLLCKASLIRQDLKGTVTNAVAALAKLGVHLSPEPSLARIISVMIRLKWIMGGKKASAIEKMPLANDERWNYIIQILHVASPAIFLTAPKMLPEISGVRIPMTFKFGLSKYIGSDLSAYGFMLSAFSNDFEGMEKMMTLAEKFNMRFGNYKDAAASRFMYHGLCRHWSASIADNACELEKNYQFSRDVGEVSMAFFSLATADVFRMLSGQPLLSDERELEEHRSAAADKKQDLMVELISICIAFRKEQAQETGVNEVMEMSQFSFRERSAFYISQKHHTHLSVLYSLYGLSHLIHNRPGDGFRSNLTWLFDHLKETGLSSLSNLLAIVFDLLNCQRSGAGDASQVRKAKKLLRRWASISPQNFGHWNHLSEAIQYRRSGNIKESLYAAEQARQTATRAGNLPATAFALEEMMAASVEQQGQADSSHHLLQEIISIYSTWGAKARLATLRKQYPSLFSARESQLLNVNSIDMESMMRASNSIAGEVRWESLLEKLSSILIENSGARRVMIFVPSASGLMEVARKTGDEPVETLQLPLDAQSHPISLVNDTARTQEIILIDDAAQHPAAIKDPYFSGNPPLSILCLPVVRHQELSAVIYLENNVTKGAFSNRVSFIKLLSGQISISIENAQLYHDMEDRISDRTRRLQEQNDKIENQNKQLEDTLARLRETQTQLIHTEKMASLGELTAGIAHEIQNPLNFINNFSELSRELLSELQELKDRNDEEERESLMGMIAQNLEKISEHGKRADGIVKNMLQHSRKRSGEKEPTDLNKLCKEFIQLTLHGFAAKQGQSVYLTEQYDPSIGEIPLEPQDIGRVLVNLAGNALFAMNEKKRDAGAEYQPQLAVKTERTEDHKVRITLSDNGPGIPPEILEKIFQPFFTTKPTGQGTGLGLSLSFDIITKGHGGQLYASSVPGQGASFIIEIPQ